MPNVPLFKWHCNVLPPTGYSLRAGTVSLSWNPPFLYFTGKSQCVCVCVCTCVLSSVWLFTTPWTVAFQAPLSMGLPSQVSMCICMCVCVCVCVCVCARAQLCPTLCNPMDSSLTGTSVHGTSQARILEWVAVSYSKGSNLSLLHLLHWQADSLPLQHPGKLRNK